MVKINLDRESLEKLIEEKTKEIDKRVQEIQVLQQRMSQLNIETLRLEGAVIQLKELLKIIEIEP